MYAAPDPEVASELLRGVLRCFAGAVVGMGIFTLLSGGVNVISSILVISLGASWLRALHARDSLPDELAKLAKQSDKDCRGCCHHCCSGTCRGTLDNVRGLAVAAIVFGVLELIAYAGWFPALALLISENYYYISTLYSCSYSSSVSSSDTVYKSYFSCNTGASIFCTINYNPDFLYSSISIPCYAGTTSTLCRVSLPSSIYYYGKCNGYVSNYVSQYADPLASWLFYAVGHTTMAAPLNIAWGVITLQILAVLTLATRGKLSSARANEATPLIYSAQAHPYLKPFESQLAARSAPTFMTGASKNGADEDAPENAEVMVGAEG
jgi:hypothetical protein